MSSSTGRYGLTKTPKPNKRTIEKIKDATLIRDVAIQIVHERGQWDRKRLVPMRCVKNYKGLCIRYETPFQLWKPRYVVSKTMTPRPMGYEITILKAFGGLCLGISWNVTGAISIEYFIRGDWEELLVEKLEPEFLAA